MWTSIAIKRVLTCLAVVSLVACGGGGGTPLFGEENGTGSTGAKSVEVLASGTTIGTASTESMTLTATVKDANNVALSGVAVVWSTDSGTLTGQSSTTDSNGVATATFGPGSDASNRVARVRVVSGSVQGALDVAISGTSIAAAGTTTLSQGATSVLTFTVTDSVGTKLPGVTLSVSSSLGNGLSATTLTTDADGGAVLTYTGSAAGTDTLTISGAGASATTTMTVNGAGADLSFVSPAASTLVSIGSAQTLTVQYTRNGVAQAGVALNVTATIGSLNTSSVTTDSQGRAQVTIQSSFAGTSTVTASLTDGSVQGSLSLRFVAGSADILVLQAETTALSPNPAGSTTYSTNIKAKVTDVNGNPVQGKTVSFSQQQDASGGQLASSTATTNSAGEASVKYYSGPTSTSSGGVVLTAAVIGADVCSNAKSVCQAALTVNGSALFISLGTGNTISNYDEQTYEKRWTATVTDANSVRVANQTLTIKIIPTVYRKGFLVWSDEFSAWVDAVAPLSCANEDTDFDGNLDPGEDSGGNRDGQLTPGNVILLGASTVTTNSDGIATIVLRYPESQAWWLSAKLTATAVVQGTESTRTATFALDVLASDFTTETIVPPGRVSPYGRDVSTCANAD